MNAGIKLNWHLNAGERFWLTQKASMKLNDNTNITVSERIDVKNLFTDPKNANFSMGLAMEFKM